MALYDDFLAGRLGNEDRLLKLAFEGNLSGDEFLRATPAERQRYLTNNQFTQNIGVNPKSAAHALRSVTNGPQQTPLTEQQVIQALSGMDPSFAQPLANEFGGMVTAWNQSMADKDFGTRLTDAASDFANSDYFIPAVATAMFGGAGAFGGAAVPAGTETASAGGLEGALASGAPELSASAGGTGFAMPPAIPAADPTFGGVLTQTAPGAFENVANISAFGSLAPSAASGASGVASSGSALAPTGTEVGDILTGTALARGIPGLLGAIASDQQADAYNDLSRDYMAIGAPARARFEASYAPGFSMENDPGFKDALNQAAKATMHALSVGGNPAGSPNAWAKSLEDLYQKSAYQALQNYRNQNAAAGGMSALTGAAPNAAGAGVQAQGNVFNAIGGAAADIFNPPKSLEDLLKGIKRAGF